MVIFEDPPAILASMELDFFVVGSRPLIFLFSTKTPNVGISPGKDGATAREMNQ